MTGGGKAPQFSRGLLTTERGTFDGEEKCQSQIEQSRVCKNGAVHLTEFAFKTEK